MNIPFLGKLNEAITLHLRIIEMTGVLMRSFSFTVLNVFWVGVGLVGMLRAGGLLHP